MIGDTRRGARPGAAPPVTAGPVPPACRAGPGPAGRRRRHRPPADHPVPDPDPGTSRAPHRPAGRRRRPPRPRPPPRSPPRGRRRVTSPVVRRLIAEHGLDAATIRGTGEGGRITRNDVLDAAAATANVPPPAPAPADRRRHRAPTPAPARLPPPVGPGPDAVPAPSRSTGGLVEVPPPRPGLARPARNPVGATRSSRSRHPPPHRRAHGALEGDERARVHLGRGRLRAGRAAPATATRQSWKATRGLPAHVPAVHRARVRRRRRTTTRT